MAASVVFRPPHHDPVVPLNDMLLPCVHGRHWSAADNQAAKDTARVAQQPRALGLTPATPFGKSLALPSPVAPVWSHGREPRLAWPAVDAIPAAWRAPWFEVPAYQQHLDTLTHSQALNNNCAQLLVDGQQSFAEKEQAMRGADIIFLKMYQFDNDAAGRRTAVELERAAQRGGRVFVQYGIKSLYSPWQLALIKLGFIDDPTPPVLRGLRRFAAGSKQLPEGQTPNVFLVPNDRPTSWRKLLIERDHEKYLITWRDGEAVKLIMGGMNISDAWLHGGEPGAPTANAIQYRDTDVEIIGPTAENAINAFIADMGVYDAETLDAILKAYSDINKTNQNVLYPPSAENAEVRFVRNKPHHGNRGQHIKSLYLSLLARVPAGETVRIANAYLLPRRDLRRALVAAANRGVCIEIVINGTESAEWEARLVAKAAHSFFRRLLRKCRCPQNLRFYEFIGNRLTGHNAMHQKVAAFGRHGPCVVGSSNLDEQSLHFNREVVALIYAGRFRQAFDAMWERDVYNGWRDADGQPVVTTRPLTPAALRREPQHQRLAQRFLYRWGVGVL